jgi:uncharacterized protein (TIGR03435 family)
MKGDRCCWRQEIGLKLMPEEGSVEMLVVDPIELPSEN